MDHAALPVYHYPIYPNLLCQTMLHKYELTYSSYARNPENPQPFDQFVTTISDQILLDPTMSDILNFDQASPIFRATHALRLYNKADEPVATLLMRYNSPTDERNKVGTPPFFHYPIVHVEEGWRGKGYGVVLFGLAKSLIAHIVSHTPEIKDEVMANECILYNVVYVPHLELEEPELFKNRHSFFLKLGYQEVDSSPLSKSCTFGVDMEIETAFKAEMDLSGILITSPSPNGPVRSTSKRTLTDTESSELDDDKAGPKPLKFCRCHTFAP
jgi:hypothetical protein